MILRIDKTAFNTRMWRRFIYAFVPCLCVLVFLDVYHYQQEVKRYVHIIEQHEQLRIQHLKSSLLSEVARSGRVLLSLVSMLEKNKTIQLHHATFDQVMQGVVRGNEQIDSVSFLDSQNNHCDANHCMPEGLTIPKLKPNELFMSDIHLRRVAGKILLPFTPLIWLAMPVFTPDGIKRGTLVLSHKSQHLYDHFDWENQNSPSQIMLLNTDAHWLYHPEKNYEWGSEFHERRHLRLSNQNRALWDQMKTQQSGQIYDQRHLYTFQRTFPRTELEHMSWLNSVSIQIPESFSWMIVARYPRQHIQELLYQKSYMHLPLFLALVLFLVLLVWSYALEKLRQLRAQLKGYEHNLKQTQTLSDVGSWSWSAQKLHCSEQAYRIFGMDSYPSNISFKKFLNCVHPDDRKNVKLTLLACMLHKKDYDMIHRIIRLNDAKECTVHAKAYVSIDGQQEAQMLGVVQDISVQLNDKERLRTLAQQDILTHVPNRKLFIERLGQNILYSQREKSRFSILYVRINDFKEINLNIGHRKADFILCESAKRLSHTVRRSDTIARISGSVFAVLLRHTFEDDDLQRVCNNLHAILHAPIFIERETHEIGVSIGVARFPDDGDDVDRLNVSANIALAHAIEQKKDVFYHNE